MPLTARGLFVAKRRLMRGDAHVGTSGWVYASWRGRFYPPRLPPEEALAHYARKLDTVEVNGTFYRLGRPETFARWRSQVSADFVFAVKGSRFITHLKKLEDEAPLANFFAQGILELGPRLGPILWQLPATFPFTADRARAFFERLPRTVREAERLARRHDHRLDGRASLRAPDGRRHPLRHALEVRHPTWLSEEALALLRRSGVALVIADAAGKFPVSFERTAPFTYVRLHGARTLYRGHYTPGELGTWARRLLERLKDGDAFVYFDNTDEAAAPEDALALRRLVNESLVANPRTTGTRRPRARRRTGTRTSAR